MGLGFSHGGASWSYSGFMSFRARLAAKIGLDLGQMQNFNGGSRPWEDIIDPIKNLLNHSDCDGELSPEECAVIAPRLRQLVEKWADYDYDKQMALRLAEGMETCATINQPLEFY